MLAGCREVHPYGCDAAVHDLALRTVSGDEAIETMNGVNKYMQFV